MAITKIIVIRNRLDKRINYALNEDKTALNGVLEYATDINKVQGEKHLYESAVNCEKENALLSMMQTKKHFGKTDKVQGYHIIQSFRPDEITPELAHQIGVEFTQKCFERYEAVIGTHLDKNHLHNHIVVNSVSFIDGKKFRNNFKDYYGDIRGISDSLCKEYGLSIIEENDKKQSVSYVEWLARNKGKTSWQTIIRNDIDDCIKQAFSYGNFIMLMEHKGYEVKQGKYISFKPFGREYFSRGYKLGNEYSIENIRNRIEGKNLSMDFIKTEKYIQQKMEFKPYKRAKPGSLKALYLHYRYLMGLVKKNQAPDKALKVLKEDLVKFERMTKSVEFVTDNNLDTVEDVRKFKDECYEEIQELKSIKVALLAEKEKYKPAFDALRIIKVYEKPHQMFLDGFHEMQEENDMYLTAFNELETLDYTLPEKIKDLEKVKSGIEDKLSANDIRIRYYRKNIRSCNIALENNRHIEEKLQKLKDVERRKDSLSAKEIAKKLLER